MQMLKGFAKNALPRLRSGLRLQRCDGCDGNCPSGHCWNVVSATAAAAHCNCIWKCSRVPSSGGPSMYAAPSRSRYLHQFLRMCAGALARYSVTVNVGALPIDKDRGSVCEPPLFVDPALGGNRGSPGKRRGWRSERRQSAMEVRQSPQRLEAVRLEVVVNSSPTDDQRQRQGGGGRQRTERQASGSGGTPPPGGGGTPPPTPAPTTPAPAGTTPAAPGTTPAPTGPAPTKPAPTTPVPAGTTPAARNDPRADDHWANASWSRPTAAHAGTGPRYRCQGKGQLGESRVAASLRALGVRTRCQAAGQGASGSRQ